MYDPRLSNNTDLYDTGVWAEPGRHGWRIFVGETGNTCQVDDDDGVQTVIPMQIVKYSSYVKTQLNC